MPLASLRIAFFYLLLHVSEEHHYKDEFRGRFAVFGLVALRELHTISSFPHNCASQFPQDPPQKHE